MSLVYSDTNSPSPVFKTFSWTEEEPLYNRLPFKDKIEELSSNQVFNLPLPYINNSSWISIEWFQQFSSNSHKSGCQSSITVYYYLDFSKSMVFLPILNWEISEFEDLAEVYKTYNFPYNSYQPLDVNGLR
mmetsp:Transcript_25002/g.22177  ORF Transcript_25002/g.22177 Transcript_25002/m.22177 type:complete len:131 (-) Transcript_25002:94-486(-)